MKIQKILRGGVPLPNAPLAAGIMRRAANQNQITVK